MAASRAGQDVLKALALGARACLIGKAFLYGLAARGGEGVTLALRDHPQANSKSAMALSGRERRARRRVSRDRIADAGALATLSRRRVSSPSTSLIFAIATERRRQILER